MTSPGMTAEELEEFKDAGSNPQTAYKMGRRDERLEHEKGGASGQETAQSNLDEAYHRGREDEKAARAKADEGEPGTGKEFTEDFVAKARSEAFEEAARIVEGGEAKKKPNALQKRLAGMIRARAKDALARIVPHEDTTPDERKSEVAPVRAVQGKN